MLINIDSEHLTENFPNFRWRSLACIFKLCSRKTRHLCQAVIITSSRKVQWNKIWFLSIDFNRILQIHWTMSCALKKKKKPQVLEVSHLHLISSTVKYDSIPHCVWGFCFFVFLFFLLLTVDKCQRAQPKIRVPESVCVSVQPLDRWPQAKWNWIKLSVQIKRAYLGCPN